MKGIITIVSELPKCNHCDELTLVDARMGDGRWHNACLEHWLTNISYPRQVPFLGVGIGQLWLPESQKPDFPMGRMKLEDMQKIVCNDDRYTMLIRGNTVVYTQDRKYNDLEKEPNVVSCALDIATRLIPHESDVQDGGIKIWLQKARGGEW